jgi:hypothetical protein
MKNWHKKAPTLLSLVILSTSLAAFGSTSHWKCAVTAEIQCAHGKYDEITRTSIAPTKDSAVARAIDAIRLLACLPRDGSLSYFKTLEEQCEEVR